MHETNVMELDFWTDVDTFIRQHRIIIDRPSKSAHPTSPQHVYPLDYGYLEGTRSNDGEGIDVWVGSLPEPGVVGVVCAVDGLKGEIEVKLLLGCSSAEIAMVEKFFSQLQMGCRVWLRDAAPSS